MKKSTLKLADFGLAWYLEPGEMLEGAAGVSTTSHLANPLPDFILGTDLDISSS